MKKFKFLLPVLAIVIAVTGAFSTKGNIVNFKNAFDPQQWVLNSNDPNDATDPSKYVLLTTETDRECGTIEEIVCKITAFPDGSGIHPELNGLDPREEQGTFQTDFREMDAK